LRRPRKKLGTYIGARKIVPSGSTPTILIARRFGDLVPNARNLPSREPEC
jgi:hypothetical protein